MTRFRVCLFAILASVLLLSPLVVESAPDPRQPQPDCFPLNASNDCSMQSLNPVTVKAKATHSASYRLLTMPGCSTGTVPGDLSVVEQELRDKVSFSLTRNDAAYDFTIRINCGSEQIRLCGAVTIFCLGRGFPYNPDVEISDIISTYYPESRYSIICHEVCGHAIGTWNEQYCPGGQSSGPCAGLARFTSTPGWVDFMNTGPNSRHLFQDVELRRWDETLYPRFVACVDDPCWDGVFWVFSSGWKVNPSTDQWFDPFGRLFWQAADQYGWRFSPVAGIALPGGSLFWSVDFGHLISP